jgi:Transposase and inactivated derivatives
MNTIKRHEDGIVNRVAHKITSGIVEGTDNVIKTIRRKAYGFRDTEYFFLRIMFESYKPRFRYVSHKILY